MSRHEISTGRGNARAIIVADIDVFGRKLTVIGIHKDKDHSRGDAFRKRMKFITQIDNPVVLVGDLNVGPPDVRHTIFIPRLVDFVVMGDSKSARFARLRGTYIGKQVDRWGKRIDYIFFNKNRLKALDGGLIKSNYLNASDHLGYYTSLRRQ